MNAVTFSRIAGTVFVLVALVHLIRLISDFPIQLGSLAVPHAASWVGLAVAGTLGFLGLRARAS
jgi:hypothetical protein